MLNFREQLAAVQHAIWSHWMKYMFSCGAFNADGSWTMPADKVERWSRQMETDYSGLTEKERMSDRDQVDKVLTTLAPLLQHRYNSYIKERDKMLYEITPGVHIIDTASDTSHAAAMAIYAFALNELNIQLED